MTSDPSLNGENLHLTPKQFDILQLLVDRLGEIVTKEDLFEIAWKADYAEKEKAKSSAKRLISMMQDALPGFPAHTLPSRFPGFPGFSTD